jgi:hypothetical protein
MQADAARSQTPTIVHSTQEGKEMPTELEQAQARIEVLQEQIRTLTLSQQAQTRQIADYNRVAELLGKPEDVILGVRAVMQQRDDLKRENAELLEETVKAKVAEKVKIESARPIIIEQVMARKPATRTDVATAIDTVMDMGSVKELLKYGLQTEMGDPQPKHTEGKSQSQPSSGVMYIPGA